jgi:hypothetical protein
MQVAILGQKSFHGWREGLPLVLPARIGPATGLHPPVAFNVEREKNIAICGLAPPSVRIGRYKRTSGQQSARSGVNCYQSAKLNLRKRGSTLQAATHSGGFRQ